MQKIKNKKNCMTGHNQNSMFKTAQNAESDVI